MKKLYFLACVVALAGFLTACGDDEPSGPVPTVEFTQDRNFLEPGDEVTFVNNSTDSDDFFWDFGDGGISRERNPTYTYTETGDFTVTLRARGSGGQEASSTSSIVVGSRFVVGIDFVKINPLDPDGVAWDDDDTGPDLVFWIDRTANNTDPRFFGVADDLVQTDLPLVGSLSPEGQFAFTSENWSFLLIDNDEPFDVLSLAEDGDDLMLAVSDNPLSAGVIDYATGEGVLKLLTQDLLTEIDIRFQLRN